MKNNYISISVKEKDGIDKQILINLDTVCAIRYWKRDIKDPNSINSELIIGMINPVAGLNVNDEQAENLYKQLTTQGVF